MDIQLRQEWSKEGQNVAEMCPKKGNRQILYMYGKKNKKKKKTFEKYKEDISSS